MPKFTKGSGKPIPKVKITRSITSNQAEELIKTLRSRFEGNMDRHKGLQWSQVEKKLKANPDKLISLNAMEETGGEPDVVGYDEKSDEYFFYDCSPETPSGRVNTCYDGKGEQERNKKGVFPAGNSVDVANKMGIELLTEEEYRELQKLGEFDLKTSSWVKTPDDIRKLGGAVFCDRRYNTIFLYHNSAPSFYSNRGFRGVVRV